MIKELGGDILFDSDRGIYRGSQMLTGVDGFVPAMVVMALLGELSEKRQELMNGKEWRCLEVNGTFVSYRQLVYYVRLLEDSNIASLLSENEREALESLTRTYVSDVIRMEDSRVERTPGVWMEPAFYPEGMFAANGDADIYNQYDALPIAGFARSAFYFFVSNTAKDYLREALRIPNLLAGSKHAIGMCKALFTDKSAVSFNSAMNRRLLDAYLAWRYEQMNEHLSEDVMLTDEDIWQAVYKEEQVCYNHFEEKKDGGDVSDLLVLHELHGKLLQRMEKDHPSLSAPARKQAEQNEDDLFTMKFQHSDDYRRLKEFLETEKMRTDRSAEKDWARHALAIYEHKIVVIWQKPNTFKEWLEKFSKVFGRPLTHDYEPGKLRKKQSGIKLYLPKTV